MEILLTGFALLACGVSVACLLRCLRTVDACETILNDMARTRGKLVACETALEELSQKVKQLAGRQYSAMRRTNAGPGTIIDNDTGEPVDDQLQAFLDLQNAKPVDPARRGN